MRLTHHHIERGRSRTGGYSREQLAALGVPWPPERGWVERAVGREVSVVAFVRFVGLRDAHLPPVESQAADLFAECS